MRTLYVEFVLTSAGVHTDCNVDDTPPHLSYKSLAKVFFDLSYMWVKADEHHSWAKVKQANVGKDACFRHKPTPPKVSHKGTRRKQRPIHTNKWSINDLELSRVTSLFFCDFIHPPWTCSGCYLSLIQLPVLHGFARDLEHSFVDLQRVQSKVCLYPPLLFCDLDLHSQRKPGSKHEFVSFIETQLATSSNPMLKILRLVCTGFLETFQEQLRSPSGSSTSSWQLGV